MTCHVILDPMAHTLSLSLSLSLSVSLSRSLSISVPFPLPSLCRTRAGLTPFGPLARSLPAGAAVCTPCGAGTFSASTGAHVTTCAASESDSGRNSVVT